MLSGIVSLCIQDRFDSSCTCHNRVKRGWDLVVVQSWVADWGDALLKRGIEVITVTHSYSVSYLWLLGSARGEERKEQSREWSHRHGQNMEQLLYNNQKQKYLWPCSCSIYSSTLQPLTSWLLTCPSLSPGQHSLSTDQNNDSLSLGRATGLIL